MQDKFPIAIIVSLVVVISVNCGRTSPPPKEDTIPPIIISTIPGNQSLNNSINTAITIVFNERIDPRSVTSETIRVRDAMTGALVEEDISCADTKVILTARLPYEIFTVYVVHATTDVMDIAGNAMLYPVTFTFTTGSQGDSTSPDILQTTPERGAVDIGVNTTIGVTFTEPMLASTISATPSPLCRQHGHEQCCRQHHIVRRRNSDFCAGRSIGLFENIYGNDIRQRYRPRGKPSPLGQPLYVGIHYSDAVSGLRAAHGGVHDSRGFRNERVRPYPGCCGIR
jgi:hypothetical protein